MQITDDKRYQIFGSLGTPAELFSSHGAAASTGKGKKASSKSPTFSLSESIHVSEHDFATEKERSHKFEVNTHSFAFDM